VFAGMSVGIRNQYSYSVYNGPLNFSHILIRAPVISVRSHRVYTYTLTGD